MKIMSETCFSATVKKQGNSCCVFVPSVDMHAIGIREGDRVEVVLRPVRTAEQ
jgi:antitoxin component of MazEF toxin-antitoxin module